MEEADNASSEAAEQVSGYVCSSNSQKKEEMPILYF